MKKLLLIAIVSTAGLFVNAQTTVTFKPNSYVGEDATLFMMDDNCIPIGWLDTPGNLNYGQEEELGMVRWTYRENECKKGSTRSLLKFTELYTIPQNAIILSAELKLYGTPTGMNTYYPNKPPNFYENSLIVKMVTSPWNENTVTWNNQPTTTNQNSFITPPSNLQYNWDYSNNSNNLISMIQYMVSNPNSNNGFLISLQNEEREYRSMRFASSDNANSELWPELIVEYNIPCDAGFSLCMNDSDNPTTFTLQANTIEGEHYWMFGNDFLSAQPSFTYVFGQTAGSDRLCHTLVTEDGYKCEKCIKFCVGDIPNPIILKNKEYIPNKITNIIPKGDKIIEDKIIIYPNPTKNIWTLFINSKIKEDIELNIINIEGKQMFSTIKTLQIGENTITLGNNTFSKGTYVLQIKGENTDFSQKIIKN